jgi:hypothetical protein
MRRPVYLTARCTRGCELWGTPAVIARHVRERRCRGVAWFRRPLDTVMIQAKYVKLLEHSLAAHLLATNAVHGQTSAPRPYRPYEVHAGAALRSPIDGVPPRVWWLVVKPYFDADVPPNDVLDLALDTESFHNLMPEKHLNQFTKCPECDEMVIDVGKHQRMSNRCRTATAANRVRTLWNDGYRDPWTAADHPPLVWGELRVVRWKHRLAVVEFPNQNAVLIASPRERATD